MLRKTTLVLSVLMLTFQLSAQKTKIRGFMDINAIYDPTLGTTSFNLGEQDLFITSDLTDRISFLGETVFKYNGGSATQFSIGLERAIFKYNYKGNHNFMAGKFHTPVNYWNDTYHHGRVFFPTVGRPESFNEHIVPIHNTGIGLMGENFGKLKFGYNFMIGNGIGSSDIRDNNKFKSLTLAAHIKPIEGMRIGGSVYIDRIKEGSKLSMEDVDQMMYSASVAYFKKIEFLGEISIAQNSTDSLGSKTTVAGYVYAGYKIKDIIVPYVRFDYLDYDKNEMYFHNNNTTAYSFGLRYEINYLTSLKAEFQVKRTADSKTVSQGINVQIAIGF